MWAGIMAGVGALLWAAPDGHHHHRRQQQQQQQRPPPSLLLPSRRTCVTSKPRDSTSVAIRILVVPSLQPAWANGGMQQQV
jgi:hypothetical protein